MNNESIGSMNPYAITIHSFFFTSFLLKTQDFSYIRFSTDRLFQAL